MKNRRACGSSVNRRLEEGTPGGKRLDDAGFGVDGGRGARGVKGGSGGGFGMATSSLCCAVAPFGTYWTAPRA